MSGQRKSLTTQKDREVVLAGIDKIQSKIQDFATHYCIIVLED